MNIFFKLKTCFLIFQIENVFPNFLYLHKRPRNVSDEFPKISDMKTFPKREKEEVSAHHRQ